MSAAATFFTGDPDGNKGNHNMEAAVTEGQTNPRADFLTKLLKSSITQEKDGGTLSSSHGNRIMLLFPPILPSLRGGTHKLKEAPELLEMYGNILAEQER